MFAACVARWSDPNFTAAAGTISADPELRTLTLKEIARAYDLSYRTVLRHVADGSLRAVKFGKRHLITIAALRLFLRGPEAEKPTVA